MKRKLYITAIALILLSLLMYEYYFIIPQTDVIKEMISSKQETLQKYERFINEAGSAEEGIKKAIAATDSIKSQLISEKSRYRAAAILQGRIESVAGKSGLKIMSIRPLNMVKYESYAGIPVYMDCSGDMKQLSEFLKLVENDAIMLKIDKININAVNITNPKDLRIRIQLSGLLKP
jgi:Tfp pilus assembly protein PilO